MMKQLVNRASLVAIAFAITLIASSPAQAQILAPAKMDVSVGYQFASLSQGDLRLNYPYGWYVDVSRTVRPMVAVVGEVGGVYRSQNNLTSHEYTYQAGVRVFSAISPMLTPFGQLLVGGTTAGGAGISDASAFSLQLGGGLNVKVLDPVMVRIAVDYRRVFFSDADGGGENDARLALGIVIPFGR